MSETIDLKLSAVPGFDEEWEEAVSEAYEYQKNGGEGFPEITVKCRLAHGQLEIGMVTKFPNPTSVKSRPIIVPLVRENGKYRIERPEQERLFEKWANT